MTLQDFIQLDLISNNGKVENFEVVRQNADLELKSLNGAIMMTKASGQRLLVPDRSKDFNVW